MNNIYDKFFAYKSANFSFFKFIKTSLSIIFAIFVNIYYMFLVEMSAAKEEFVIELDRTKYKHCSELLNLSGGFF